MPALNVVHATVDGPIHVFVARRGRVWITRIVGRQLDSAVPCATQREAARVAKRRFRQMFPEHVCGADCRP